MQALKTREPLRAEPSLPRRRGLRRAWQCAKQSFGASVLAASIGRLVLTAAIALSWALLSLAPGDGWLGSRTAHAKVPPVAEPMYLSAHASLITGRPAKAVTPLTHLVNADPSFADVQNALAVAIFSAYPEQRARALEHARKAVELAPEVPQLYSGVANNTAS